LPETTVLDAAKAMADKNYGSVIVVDKDDKVIGVVTERDVMNKIVAREIDASVPHLTEDSKHQADVSVSEHETR